MAARRPRPWGIDDDGRCLVALIVQAAVPPVYGLADHPLGLACQGVGYSGVSYGTGPPHVVGVRCEFGAHLSGQAPCSISIESCAPPAVLPTDSPRWRDTPPQTQWYATDGPAYERCATLDEARRAGDRAGHLLIETLTIGGDQFCAQIQEWTRPDQEQRVVLTGRDVVVTGSTLGVSRAQLLDVLAHLTMINGRADLLARYQEEYDSWRLAH